jgi:hypothetical protein
MQKKKITKTTKKKNKNKQPMFHPVPLTADRPMLSVTTCTGQYERTIHCTIFLQQCRNTNHKIFMRSKYLG